MDANKTPAGRKRLSYPLPVKPGVFEALDLVGQLAPVPHQFQISVSGFRVFCFLRRDVAFRRLYPKQFRSRRHQNQRGATGPVPSNSTRSASLRSLPSRVPAGQRLKNKTYSHAVISRSSRWTRKTRSARPTRRCNDRDGRRRAILLRRRRRHVGASIRKRPMRANASRIVPSVSLINSGSPRIRPQICHSATMSSVSVDANSGSDSDASACSSVTATKGGVWLQHPI